MPAVADRAYALTQNEDRHEPIAPVGLRRIEDWLVSQLDGGRPKVAAGETLASWRLDRRDPTEAAARGRRAGQATSQSVRLGLFRAGDVTVVRVAVASLLKEDILEDTAEQLDSLVAAGAHRIVLNFAAVERLSSPLLTVIVAAHERCRARPGGELRLCGIRAELRTLFDVTGLAKTLAIHGDEAEALGAPWPGSGEPLPLPLSILTMLRRHDAAGDEAPMNEQTGALNATALETGDSPRLRVVSGRWAGMELTLTGERLKIGRDETCPLRCNAATVSRLHAEIEIDCRGRLVLRDLGSTNGTGLNERTLRADQAFLEAGDRVHIGPMRLEVIASTGASAATARIDEQIAHWLTVRAREGDSGELSVADTYTVDAEETPTNRTETRLAVGSIVEELFNDVLVLTPRGLPLNTEDGAEALRSALQAMLDEGRPQRVVVNLDTAGTLSSRTIGLLLAHALRLEGLGGALRLAQPQPRMRTWLEHLRIPLLVDLYATVDEAVIATWG